MSNKRNLKQPTRITKDHKIERRAEAKTSRKSMHTATLNRRPNISPNYRTKSGGAMKINSPIPQSRNPMQVKIPSKRNPSIRNVSHSRSLSRSQSRSPTPSKSPLRENKNIMNKPTLQPRGKNKRSTEFVANKTVKTPREKLRSTSPAESDSNCKPQPKKQAPSLSEFWADAEFIDFLKKVACFCNESTTNSAIDSLGPYKVLYQNLFGLREQFLKFKHAKDDRESSDSETEKESESDHSLAHENSDKENLDQSPNYNHLEISSEIEKSPPVTKNSLMSARYQAYEKTEPVSKLQKQTPRRKNSSKVGKNDNRALQTARVSYARPTSQTSRRERKKSIKREKPMKMMPLQHKIQKTFFYSY